MSLPSTKGVRVRINQRLQGALPPARYRSVVEAYGAVRAAARSGPGYGRILPSFLIIGTTKSGTTTLYRWISEHPFVAPCSVKETHYFSNYYTRGSQWYRSQFPRQSERDAFAREHGRPFITGEASPSYISHYWAPQRIARELPDVKLIVTMRNPVDRAHSHFQMSRRLGDEPLSTFEEALAAEEQRLAGEDARMRNEPYYRSYRFGNWGYLARGHYVEQLEKWFAAYPRERIHLLSLEELSTRPHETLDAVHEFLGLPPFRAADLEPRHVGEYDPLAPETRARLAELFRPDNQRLYELAGRDFGWDRPAVSPAASALASH
jgi:hypothetical protein